MPATVIASTGEAGALYGTFHFLRLHPDAAAARAASTSPSVHGSERRLLNHWDNLDGTIERGYAGRSLWWPDRVDQRRRGLRARQRVDRHQRRRHQQRQRQPAVADRSRFSRRRRPSPRMLRPYGIRVYLAANFAAPKMLGGLTTDDPLDPAVAQWWRAKADEIYTLIPDFGGFVVKANSEGQPGPQDYGRTHADGANVLADAVAPHGGIVMWRAFVYDADVDPDRVKRAYTEFVPLDGRFRENVFAQVKNGPLDFQPREPFHPLFGAMPKTPLMAELQITQEYLGQSNHLVYLAPMWKEFLDADTYAKGTGSHGGEGDRRIARGQARTGIAGVANTGLRRQLDAATISARPTGTPSAGWRGIRALSAGAIADEWIRMTWGHAPDLRRDHPIDDARLARGVRALHHAARPASPDRRRPLRADAREHRSAPGGLVRHLLSPRRRVGHRLRSHAPRQRRCGTVPLAAARAVERSRDHSRRAAAVVSSPALGLPHEVGTDAVGRAGPVRTAAAPKRRRDSRRGGRRCAAKSTRSGTRPCSPSFAGRRHDAAAWRDKCVRYFQTPHGA